MTTTPSRWSRISKRATPTSMLADPAFSLGSSSRISQPVPDRGEIHLDRRAMGALFKITSEKVDRSGDRVRCRGIQTANHQRSPVALLDHGEVHSLPLGKCETHEGAYTVRLHQDYGTAQIWFAQDDRVAEQVFALVDAGCLRGASIGFRPLKAHKRHDYGEDGYHDSKASGLEIEECELLEVSVVPIPDQPEALLIATEVLGRDRLEGAQLEEPIRKSLSKLAIRRKSWRAFPSRPHRGFEAALIEAKLSLLGDRLHEIRWQVAKEEWEQSLVSGSEVIA